MLLTSLCGACTSQHKVELEEHQGLGNSIATHLRCNDRDGHPKDFDCLFQLITVEIFKVVEYYQI